MQAAEIITDLQTRGVSLLDPGAGANSRRGGAGPTDHKALNYWRIDRDGASAHRQCF